MGNALKIGEVPYIELKFALSVGFAADPRSLVSDVSPRSTVVTEKLALGSKVVSQPRLEGGPFYGVKRVLQETM